MPQTPLEQRHDFMLSYYSMAVKDLERHLKFGVDSISVSAAVVASIVAIAASNLNNTLAYLFALTALMWGIWTLTSANYWAIRAIAFLANVESVYFSKEDRSYLNSYAGAHPPYHFIDSLGGHAVLFFALYVLVCSLGTVELSAAVDQAGGAGELIANGQLNFTWVLFSILSVCVVLVAFWRYFDRLLEYEKFVRECPGPGLVDKVENVRGASLQLGQAAILEGGPSVQARTLGEFGKLKCRIQITGAVMTLIILLAQISGWCGLLTLPQVPS